VVHINARVNPDTHISKSKYSHLTIQLTTIRHRVKVYFPENTRFYISPSISWPICMCAGMVHVCRLLASSWAGSISLCVSRGCDIWKRRARGGSRRQECHFLSRQIFPQMEWLRRCHTPAARSRTRSLNTLIDHEQRPREKRKTIHFSSKYRRERFLRASNNNVFERYTEPQVW
jgi:hypothetical protein